MGRKAGGKNFENIVEEPQSIIVTETERRELPDIFMSIHKDFITIKDLMETSGLSYETCSKIIREIKSVSDVFKIAGCVHRTDYFMFLSRRFMVLAMEGNG